MVQVSNLQAPKQTLTLEEFLKLPETKPASEYIDGQIIQKPMPQGKHSRSQGQLVTSINAVVESQRIALALLELRCTFGGRSTVPDVAIFRWERIPLDPQGTIQNVFLDAPDWTIEILSPDQSQNKVTRNILHCLEYGCQLGWLFDPDDRSLLVYPPGQQPQFFEEADIEEAAVTESFLPVPEFAAGLQLTLNEVLGWLSFR